MTLDPSRTGVAVGAVFGLWHLIWSALVAVGWARWLLDFVLWAHFLKLSVALEPFQLGRAAVLVAFTTGVGWIVGALFAVVWNRLHRRAPQAAVGEAL